MGREGTQKHLKAAKITRLEILVREELGKLTPWGKSGKWCMVVVGRTCKAYNFESLQPVLDIYEPAPELQGLYGERTRSDFSEEWEEMAILKRHTLSMGAFTINDTDESAFCAYKKTSPGGNDSRRVIGDFGLAFRPDRHFPR